MKVKARLAFLLVMVAAGALIELWLFPPSASRFPTPLVHAQGIGTGGSFSINFSFPYTASRLTVYVPACTATVQTNCIPNNGQVSETVSFNFSSGCTATSPATPGFVELDGSNDGVHYLALGTGAANVDTTATFGTISSNGFFLFKRLAIWNCTTSSSGTVSGTYTGYSTPLPLNPVSKLVANIQPGSGLFFGGSISNGYLLIQSFQCQNPNAATSFLQLSSTVGSTTIFYQMGIPAGTLFSYTGPPMLGVGAIAATAVTTWNGGTPSATPLNCSFQIAPGPYYPNAPLSQL